MAFRTPLRLRDGPLAILLLRVMGAVGAAGVGGCRGDEAEGDAAPGSAPSASAAASASASAGPRRPSRRYYMGRTKEERCEVYTVEGDVITPRGTAPCPVSIEVGERIRLTGPVCMREGTKGREQPVVCPGELFLTERDDRAKALEEASPPPPSSGAPRSKRP